MYFIAGMKYCNNGYHETVHRKYIELHGRPTSAVFSSEAAVSGRNFYELSWQVDSFVPLLEYRLLYRR